MSGPLLAEDWEDRLGDINDSEEVGVNLGAEIRYVNVFDGCGVGISSIVDHHVDATKFLMFGLGGPDNLVIDDDI